MDGRMDIRDAKPNEQKSHMSEANGAICELGFGLREFEERSNPEGFDMIYEGIPGSPGMPFSEGSIHAQSSRHPGECFPAPP